MEIQELKQRIKENNIPNFLIFTGEEYAVQKLYIKHIAQTRNLTIRYVESVTDILTELSSTAFIKVDHCYVVIDDKELMTNEKLQGELIPLLNADILILTLTSPDKRTKFYKTYKDSIIEFNALKSDLVKRYIQKEIDLSDKNCNALIEVCEGNYSRCLLEIDKIKRYSESNPTLIRNIYNNGFEIMMADGTIHKPPQDAIFDLVSAILHDDAQRAYSLLQECKEIGESNLAILTVLFNNTKQVLQVQNCESKDIEKTTGLSYWQIKNAKECCGKFSTNNLIYIMRLIQSTESKIKAGEIDESIAVEYVMSNIL